MSASTVPEPNADLMGRAAAVKRAAATMACCDDQQRRGALLAMARSLEQHRTEILKANAADLAQARSEDLAAPLLARLELGERKSQQAIEGVRGVAALADPLHRRQLHTELDEGLVLERLTVPLGVVGAIFEARPDAMVQISALAVRSGNGALLKGGREAQRTNEAIHRALREGLKESAGDPEALEMLTSRSESMAMLRLDGLVDLIIPRGSKALVRFIQNNTRIPVLGHADGVCHLYVDRRADLKQALRIALDSKTQYPAACNAIETLLVHRDVAGRYLPSACEAFAEAGVELRGDAASCSLGVPIPATEEDWGREYLDLILAVKQVANLDEALEHIRRFGSRHTDAIVSDDPVAVETFLLSVDSAGVFHNCSTRFADGFRYGFGAEVGISTQTLPPRGPVGLDSLVTYRYRLCGRGHVVAPYASGDRQFSHRPLPL